MTSFGVVDAVIFVVMILVALGIGIFYGIKDRHKQSLNDYFYAEQSMSSIPVGISLGVTFISSITILSIPVLTYNRGSVVFWYGLAGVVATFPAFFYFIPFFHRLQMPSIYRFLELRFHVSVRKACSLVACFLMTCWMGIASHLTSLALNVVFPLTVTQSTLLTAVIVTFYTVVGGIKAVVWVDTVQSVLMVAGVIAVSIKTSNQIGGIGYAWEVMREEGRDTFLTFDTDVTVNYSFWTICFGLGTAYAQYYCCNQAFAQRFQACRSATQARIACVISGTLTCLLVTLSTICGCLMYVYFKGCDPYKSGAIEDKDQTVPYLVVKIFKDVPGIAGLFVSAAYSAMLSTVSSGINSLSTLILEDFVRPCMKKLNEKTAIRLSQLIGILIGITVMGTSFAVKYFGDLAFVLVNTIESAFGGPLLGLFFCGAFLPWTNKIGSLAGLLSGVTINLWLAIGNQFYGGTPGKNPTLPLSIENCMNVTTASPYNNINENMTMMTVASIEVVTSTIQSSSRPLIADTFYQVSYFYYSLIGLFTCISVSLVVSFATGRRDPSKSDPAFFIPLISGGIFSQDIQRFFRFGVPEYSESSSQYYREKYSKKKDEQISQYREDQMEKPFISSTSQL